ncbi:MAG: hypothetical protein K8F91_13160, partial [Candidatus Obscuribacterales bacterium]|nr:hypothetical protein [Candidatus Obscuribacterales bacterium]
DRLAAVRIEHTQRLLHKLRASGLNISMDDVLAFSKEGSIGKAHVTKAIVKAGGAPDITSAYNKFLCPRAQFFERRRWLDACEAICLVRKSGGIASLAHPGSYDRAFEIVEALSNQGLDALEVYHPMHDPASIEIFKGQAYQFGLHVTGGSDCHGPYEEHPPSLGSMELPSYIVQELDGLVASRV